MMMWMHESHFDYEILISGNFSETAWRATHSRQAAHAYYMSFGVFLRAGPGGETLYRQATQMDG